MTPIIRALCNALDALFGFESAIHPQGFLALHEKITELRMADEAGMPARYALALLSLDTGGCKS